MSRLVFVDESKQGAYLLVAVTISAVDSDAVRTAVAAHRRKGQRRIHFTSEDDATRLRVLATIQGLPLINSTIYDARPRTPEASARARCFNALVDDVMAAPSPVDLVIELDSSLLKPDRKTLFDASHRVQAGGRLSYRHLASHEDAGLWISDALGWCWRRGGHWKTRVAPLIQIKQV